MRTPTPGTNPDAALLRDLAARVDREVAAALGGAREVALVNFPNHNNPGDSAIWLGARASLRRLGVRVRYSCAWCTFNNDALRRAFPEGPVLINGGGNFGDLYKGQQDLREQLFAELRGRRLVQLPQSIHFRKPANLDRVRRLVEQHGDVVIMTRERRSEALAREVFAAEVRLAPDMALGLGHLVRADVAPDVDVLWLHRRPRDPEYVAYDLPSTTLSVQDVEWIRPTPPEPPWSVRARAARRVNDVLLPKCRTDPRWARRAWRPLAATFGPLGDGFVDRGLAIMGRGRVLVTDKLHGHVMAVLSGMPHVVLDNSYGKVSGTYETWTHPSVLARWAESGEQAMVAAAELLETHPA